MLNQISLANTFQHLVTSVAGLISLSNLLTDGSVFIANTQLQVTGAGTSLIVNNSIFVGNTIHVNGSLNLITNSVKTNMGAATITFPTTTDTLIGANSVVTLTNKTLTAPNINSPVITTNGGAASITLPQTSQRLVGQTESIILTNKTLASPTLTDPTMSGNVNLGSTPILQGTILYLNLGNKRITFPTSNSTAVDLTTAQDISTKQFFGCNLFNCLAETPVDANSVVNRDYVDTQISSQLTTQFTTGDVKLTLKTIADAGWVLMNDGSIGDASSSATTRANADTQALFTLIYNNTSDTDCPVSGGRTGNATNDFNAHKRLTLPKALGRALATYGTGAGLNAKRLGEVIGQEDAVVVDHGHSTVVNQTPHTHSGSFLQVTGTAIVTTGPGNVTGQAMAAANAIISVTVSNSGVSGTAKNWQPTLFLNTMIKL